jgi:protein-L-isoaspartate(D-aspartate) O-methyltransferase
MNDIGEMSDQERMIQQQIIDRGIRDQRVIAAMRAVPRDRFFPSTNRAEAFADRAAPIGHGQTISQPYIVALMTQRLSIEPAHRVLEIGTGSGYQTAILAQLAGEVFTVERVKPLLDAAWERLMSMGIRNVHFRHGDGTTGWPDAAPFDRLVITASAPELPEQLLRTQLIDGGIAVLPFGRGENQMLIEVRRDGNRLDTADVCPCRFVRLIGQEGWPET